MADIISSQSGNIILRTPELGDGSEDNPVSVNVEGSLTVDGNASFNGIQWPIHAGNVHDVLTIVSDDGVTEWTDGTGGGGNGEFLAGDGINFVATGVSGDDTIINVGAGDGLTVSADAISHSNTSDIADITLTDGNVIQGMTFDAFGHVISTTTSDLDDRYTTTSDSDNRYVNIDGDTMTGELTAPSFDTNSALRYKENVDYNVVDALSKVLSIDVISYVSKADKTKKKRLGVSAESVAKVAPEFVSFTDDGQVDSVNYGQMTALLIQAIKEQEQNRPTNILRSFFARMMSKIK